jgi:hypothetical protein
METKNMTNTTAKNVKEAAYHGVPAEDEYGYAQAIKIGNSIYMYPASSAMTTRRP